MKTLDELRRTPTHIVCEHGSSQRSCDACECLALETKLNTLEAAVRAVRDDEHIEWYHDLHPDQALSKLYALVPDGSEGGS